MVYDGWSEQPQNDDRDDLKEKAMSMSSVLARIADTAYRGEGRKEHLSPRLVEGINQRLDELKQFIASPN